METIAAPPKGLDVYYTWPALLERPAQASDGRGDSLIADSGGFEVWPRLSNQQIFGADAIVIPIETDQHIPVMGVDLTCDVVFA